MSRTITLQFEDTPAVRAMLRQLGAHCADDNVPFFENLDDTCEDELNDLPEGVDAQEQADAYAAFDETVIAALVV